MYSAKETYELVYWFMGWLREESIIVTCARHDRSLLQKSPIKENIFLQKRPMNLFIGLWGGYEKKASSSHVRAMIGLFCKRAL